MCLCSWPWLDNCVLVGSNTNHVSLIHWFSLVQYSASWPDTQTVHCEANCLCRDRRLTGLLKVTCIDLSSAQDSRFKVICHYTTQGCMIKWKCEELLHATPREHAVDQIFRYSFLYYKFDTVKHCTSILTDYEHQAWTMKTPLLIQL